MSVNQGQVYDKQTGGNLENTIVSSAIPSGFSEWVIHFDGPLITANDFDVNVNDVAMTTVTFAVDFATTLTAIATQLDTQFAWIVSAPTTKVYTDNVGIQKGQIIVKGLQDVSLILDTPAVSAGASQVAVEASEQTPLKNIPAQLIVDSKEGLASRVEDVDGTGATEYVGYAKPGANEAYPMWQIKRVTRVTGPPATTNIDWADGDSDFNKKWSGRAGYTY